MVTKKTRITFAQVAPSCFFVGSRGWQITANHGQTVTFHRPKGMSNQDKTEATNYIKGYRKMVARANQESDPAKAMNKMRFNLCHKDIVTLGERGVLRFTDYTMDWGRTWWVDDSTFQK